MDIPDKIKEIIRITIDKKAKKPILINVGSISNIADYFLVVTANSDLHAKTIADEIEEKLGEKDIKPFNIEGYENASWILMDYGDIMIHIFRQDVRDLYSLESLWMDAPQYEIREENNSIELSKIDAQGGLFEKRKI